MPFADAYLEEVVVIGSGAFAGVRRQDSTDEGNQRGARLRAV